MSRLLLKFTTNSFSASVTSGRECLKADGTDKGWYGKKVVALYRAQFRAFGDNSIAEVFANLKR
jgi:hypothetical protein